ncbi:hypothetical protein [Serratia odorifera]|uniref:hypothetical protein n=1 Tax=Serratia odorifera TaxID=618 RepID=UPI001D104A00|nr:hypothetical protein [Serratia odorifera]
MPLRYYNAINAAVHEAATAVTTPDSAVGRGAEQTWTPTHSGAAVATSALALAGNDVFHRQPQSVRANDRRAGMTKVSDSHDREAFPTASR